MWNSRRHRHLMRLMQATEIELRLASLPAEACFARAGLNAVERIAYLVDTAKSRADAAGKDINLDELEMAEYVIHPIPSNAQIASASYADHVFSQLVILSLASSRLDDTVRDDDKLKSIIAVGARPVWYRKRYATCHTLHALSEISETFECCGFSVSDHVSRSISPRLATIFAYRPGLHPDSLGGLVEDEVLYKDPSVKIARKSWTALLDVDELVEWISTWASGSGPVYSLPAKSSDWVRILKQIDNDIKVDHFFRDLDRLGIRHIRRQTSSGKRPNPQLCLEDLDRLNVIIPDHLRPKRP